MKRSPLLILGLGAAVFLSCTLSGCASYAPAFIPADIDADNSARQSIDHGEAPMESADQRRVIKVGQEVRIFTSGGNKVVGEVVRLSSETVVVGKIGNYGPEETSVAVINIVKIESRYSSRAVSWSFGVVGVIVIGFTVLAALVTTGGGFGSN
jgi:hypothetical protein